jgi:hypothetical protein
MSISSIACLEVSRSYVRTLFYIIGELKRNGGFTPGIAFIAFLANGRGVPLTARAFITVA